MILAPVVPLSGQHIQLRDGLPGIYQTIGIMRDLVNDYRTDSNIRQAAISSMFLTPEKDQYSEVESIFNSVRDNIRYVRDIVNVETIATPDKTILCRVGDCDDQALLLASMLESVGYPTRFVVAAYTTPNVPEHVYLQVFANGHWIDCDPTERASMGYAPPDPLTTYIENV